MKLPLIKWKKYNFKLTICFVYNIFLFKLKLLLIKWGNITFTWAVKSEQPPLMRE